MTRTIVASLPDTSTMYQLYDIMAVITHLNPSFHPVPSNQIVHIKVDADKAEEAKTLLKQA
jgi:galactitol-specific phosphotransferase system IIB component